jgi:hypothetical protein
MSGSAETFEPLAVETLEPIPDGRPLSVRPGRVWRSRAVREVVMSKSADKPKKQQKKKPQKTLKERRSEKRAARKLGSASIFRADE